MTLIKELNDKKVFYNSNKTDNYLMKLNKLISYLIF